MGIKLFDWKGSLSVDLRSLGLFRIAFGLCLFVDVLYRMFFLNTFYTDQGLMPRAALVEKFLNAWEMSLFLISGQWLVTFLLFSVLLTASVGLILGFHTRFCAFICWVFVCSMQVRNQVVLHGGDDVFRLMLFWMQFVPIGAELSLDKFLNPSKTTIKDYRYLSVGTAGLLLQVCAIYFFTALLKWHPVWHSEGSAVYYALGLDQFASPIGLWVRQFPEFMRIMTFMTVGLEFLGPIFVLMPVPLFQWRMFFVLAFIGFHFGLAMTMELGVFPWVCMAMWLAFIPPSFWKLVGEVSFARFKKMGDWLKTKAKGRPPLLVYTTLNQTVASVFLITIIYWNLSHLDALKLKKPAWLWPVMSITETYQKWSMFAPYPRKDDGWYVMEGALFNGEKVDIWSKDHVVRFEKPKSVSATYRDSLWRKYLTNLWLSSYNKHRLYLGRYLCRLWNDKHEGDQRVNTIEVLFMLENTPKPGEPVGEISKEIVWNHYCFSKPEGAE